MIVWLVSIALLAPGSRHHNKPIFLHFRPFKRSHAFLRSYMSMSSVSCVFQAFTFERVSSVVFAEEPESVFAARGRRKLEASGRLSIPKTRLVPELLCRDSQHPLSKTRSADSQPEQQAALCLHYHTKCLLCLH